jgi:TonB family protein
MKAYQRGLAGVMAAGLLVLPAASQTRAGFAGSVQPPAYPDALRAAGHQGVVTVKGMIQADGTLTDTAVEVSSGSAGLDQAMLAWFKAQAFKPATDEAGHAIAAEGKLSHTFVKDSIETVGTKSCADFSTDVAWFEQTHPGAAHASMFVYTLVLNSYAIKAIEAAPERVVDRFKGGYSTLQAPNLEPLYRRFKTAFDKTIGDCASQPTALFLDTLKRYM